MVQLYKRCTSGEVAEDWKKANVSAVFKKSKKEELQRNYRGTTGWRNYRLVSLIIYCNMLHA